MTGLRVGNGYDIHRLGENRPLMLAGVRVDYPRGLVGHSDADVVLHAVCDAWLGAAALGDIGEFFPDTDARYKDADSAVLLGRVCAAVRAAGYEPVNMDCIVFCQVVRLTAYKPHMRDSLSRITGMHPAAIGLKAKTMEQMDAVGSGQAIAASCVVLLEHRG